MTNTNLAPVSARATGSVLAALVAAKKPGQQTVTVTRNYLANTTGYKPRTVTRALAALRADGRVSGGQGTVGTPAEYRVAVEETDVGREH